VSKGDNPTFAGNGSRTLERRGGRAFDERTAIGGEETVEEIGDAFAEGARGLPPLLPKLSLLGGEMLLRGT